MTVLGPIPGVIHRAQGLRCILLSELIMYVKCLTQCPPALLLLSDSPQVTFCLRKELIALSHLMDE